MSNNIYRDLMEIQKSGACNMVDLACILENSSSELQTLAKSDQRNYLTSWRKDWQLIDDQINEEVDLLSNFDKTNIVIVDDSEVFVSPSTPQSSNEYLLVSPMCIELVSFSELPQVSDDVNDLEYEVKKTFSSKNYVVTDDGDSGLVFSGNLTNYPDETFVFSEEGVSRGQILPISLEDSKNKTLLINDQLVLKSIEADGNETEYSHEDLVRLFQQNDGRVFFTKTNYVLPKKLDHPQKL